MAKKKAKTNKRAHGSNNYRIIGGQWRSRKLPFIDAVGLRPTPDRIRETLFNWLQADIHGAYCLDLFAGSGALGFEALSRGAGELVFVEKNTACSKQLKDNLALLENNSLVVNSDALGFNALYRGFDNKNSDDKTFDIVFLDPPYRQGLIEKSLTYLSNEDLIGHDTLVYAEHEAEESIDWAEFDFHVLKQANAGQVQSFLLQKIR